MSGNVRKKLGNITKDQYCSVTVDKDGDIALGFAATKPEPEE